MDNNKIFGYSVIKQLGKGSFGEVVLAQKGSQKVAIKKISKKQIIKVNKLHEPFIEKEILLKLNEHCKQPLFVKIFETESDDDNVYLMLEYCSKGTLEDLFFNETIDTSLIRHIAAKIVLSLERLHALGVIHRDLKSSNFLITSDGFVKLSDFGTAYAPDSFYEPAVAERIKSIKEMCQNKEAKERKDSQSSENTEQRRSTFVGTACYMAPELLTEDRCGKEADIWAFGCILYEMIFKKSPFFDHSEGMVWKKILSNEVSYPEGLLTGDQQKIMGMDLIKKILVKDVDKRLGHGPDGYKHIKGHAFFRYIDWEKELTLPLVLKGAGPTSQTGAEDEMFKPSVQKERVLLSGVVGKKAFFGNFKDRNLILYSTPKLVYYQEETGQLKGEILLEKGTPVSVEGKVFSITNQKKTYYFKSKNSLEWVEMIRSAIINAYY